MLDVRTTGIVRASSTWYSSVCTTLSHTAPDRMTKAKSTTQGFLVDVMFNGVASNL